MNTTPEEVFSVKYGDKDVKVEGYNLKNGLVYLVYLTQPVFVAQARDNDGYLFWTTIPEGRRQLAKELGALIDAHIAKPPDGTGTLF